MLVLCLACMHAAKHYYGCVAGVLLLLSCSLTPSTASQLHGFLHHNLKCYCCKLQQEFLHARLVPDTCSYVPHVLCCRRVVNGLQVLIAKGHKNKRRNALAGKHAYW